MFIHFCNLKVQQQHNFKTKCDIWVNGKKSSEVLSHFAGIRAWYSDWYNEQKKEPWLKIHTRSMTAWNSPW